MSANQSLEFHYRFTFADQSVKQVDVALDERSLDYIAKLRKSYPKWVQLSYRQCPNCPLSKKKYRYCPVAQNLADLIEDFGTSISFHEADVEVTSSFRHYAKRVPLADGLSSVVGLIMVTSGCPILSKLKPMVRTHLPFASFQETFFRAIGIYFMAQYFRERRGRKPDWSLEQLHDVSTEISTVNHSFCRRLSDTVIQDATLNAIVQLDCFAGMTSQYVRKRKIDQFEPLFDAYLK